MHFPCVMYDQTMDQTACQKPTLRFRRKSCVLLRIEREEKNILVKSNEQE